MRNFERSPSQPPPASAGWSWPAVDWPRQLNVVAVACGLLLGFGSTVQAGEITLPPVLSLPAAPTTPYLWFDGSDPGVVTAVKDRRTDPRTMALYDALKLEVDNSTLDLTTPSVLRVTDPPLARFAKLAALLAALEFPAGSTYRDDAVSAIKMINGRQPAADPLNDLAPPNPEDMIHVLQDSGYLQSMAEAYDLLRGTGVSAADDTAMQDKIADWADAYAVDLQLTGCCGFSGHRDNWGLKGGSALITAALAMPDHANALNWLAAGQTFVLESMDRVASDTGWYRESAGYLGYALNNLWSTAWHVKNATGVDWLTAMKPWADFALALRQPDGRSAPFEESLGGTYPWDVMATAYPSMASTILWAWDNSDKDSGNYHNQSAHVATRLLLYDLTTVAAAPTQSPTRFVDGDARLVALATSWEASALQVTGLTAEDHSTDVASFPGTIFETPNPARHNQQNPLDLVIHDSGEILVPTASGGPRVTRSTDRAAYLLPSAKNIPLVNGTAPFLDPNNPPPVTLGSRLDSADEGAFLNHFADLGRTTVDEAYAAGSSLSRGLALVDESFIVVVDRITLATQETLGLSWRGRGTRTETSAIGPLVSEAWSGPAANPVPITLDVASSRTLTAVQNSSFFADSFTEPETSQEVIDAVIVQTVAPAAAFISVFHPNQATPGLVTEASGPDVAAVIIDRGANDITIVAPETGFQTADGVGTDGYSAFVERDAGGAVTRFCVDNATSLVVDGDPVLTASTPVTFCATPHDDGLIGEVSPDTPGVTVTIDLLRLARPTFTGRTWTATTEGDPTGATTNDSAVTLAALGAGTLELTEATGGLCDDYPGDAECLDVASCEPTTGVWTYGSLPDDPDGLFCTENEECIDGVFTSTPVECGAPADQCSLESVCDEASETCVDSGVVACEAQTIAIAVTDATGTVTGEVRCFVNDGVLSCELDETGKLVLHTEALTCE
ncbi:MAG: hypothetical protein ACI9MR_001419 [Myxococcota bacterium]|jgi:hypothetical protein